MNLIYLLAYSALVYVLAVVMQALASNANRTLVLILLTVSAREDTQMRATSVCSNVLMTVILAAISLMIASLVK